VSAGRSAGRPVHLPPGRAARHVAGVIRRLARLAALAGTAAARPAAAQPPAPDSAAAPAPSAGAARDARRPRLSAQAVAQGARAANTYAGRARTEGALTQPVVMLHGPLARGRVRLTATFNVEALTLPRGQLNPGSYGEGFVDRRHPHTWAHELMAAVAGRVPGLPAAAGVRASLAAGKGFVAFGTDDPMMRPFTLFPVNHHLAQVLERYAAVGAVRLVRPRLGDATVEATLFGGDEPTGPRAWPRARRFGDSRALRATWRPAIAPRRAAPGGSVGDHAHHGASAGGHEPGHGATGPPLELSASVARVRSPEDAGGVGLDHHKGSLSARWASGAALGAPGLGGRGAGEYALAEWARTDELRAGRRALRYESVLFEAAARRRGVELAARWERTARPEEERLVDPFRTVRPHNEFNVLGLTEWRTATANVGVPVRAGALRLLPFAEAARAVPRAVLRPTAFEPGAHYGAGALWTAVVGLRFGAGTPHARMGRYGVLAGG